MVSDEWKIAQVGLRNIETAILNLLRRRPDGMRNSEIAEELGLRSSFEGRQKDYLTYSILGKLLAEGLITRDGETKNFKLANSDIRGI